MATTPMPMYSCHKQVWALKIRKIYKIDEDNFALSFEDSRYDDRIFDVSFLDNRPIPSPGWYYVQYADGYESFSPEKTFEEGYTLESYSREQPEVGKKEVAE